MTKKELSRREMLRRGALVGGAAIWVPPLIQSVRIPAAAATGSGPPPCIVDTGFMTGGGKIGSNPEIQYNIAGQIDCKNDPSDVITINWSTGKGSHKINYSFSTTAITATNCAMNPDPSLEPPQNANFNETSGTATGTLTITGQPDQSASLTFDFIDGGEGSGSNDYATLVLTGATSGTLVNLVHQVVSGANLQTHGNTAFGNAC